MFILHTANHARHLRNVTEAGGPVGDGEPGVVAGNQGPGDDEDKSSERGENREIVMRPVEGRGQRTFQVRLLISPTSQRAVMRNQRWYHFSGQLRQAHWLASSVVWTEMKPELLRVRGILRTTPGRDPST